MTKDYYKILGVAEFESADEIKKAYRKLARMFHPDVAGNSIDAINRFKEINEAYATLSDKNRKEEYDKARRFYNYAKKEHEVKENTYKETSKSDKKNKKFDFNEFFAKNFYENNHAKTRVSKKGNDIYSDIEISITEAMLGTNKTINVLQTTLCPKCKGHKFINGSICLECNGTGEHAQYTKLTVKIPAGIKNKSKIRLAGEGERGQNGGNNGDLYLVINIKEPEASNNKINIYKTIPITPFEAVLGGEISISTPSGDVKMTIPANTQNGQKFSLSKCGYVQKEKIGDMIITVEIKIPYILSKEEISLYQKLKDISSSNIRDTYYDR